MTPEHLHLALNHIPIIGLACAAVPLFWGIVTQSRPALVSGLLLAVLCGGVTFAVMETGEQAAERYENPPVSNYLDANFEHFLEIHEERAEAGSKAMYAAASLAVLSLILLFWKPSAGRWSCVLVLLACLAAVAAGIRIADAGGQIRRPDFRSSSSPAQS